MPDRTATCNASISASATAGDHGRQARLIELEPKYVDTICRRWEQYTERKATLADGGREFEQVAEDRAPVVS